MTDTFRDLLLAGLEEIEAHARELADAVDAGDFRAVRLPIDVVRRARCLDQVAFANRVLTDLVFLLDPASHPPEHYPAAAKTLSELRDLLWSIFAPSLEWLIVAPGADPEARVPEDVLWIACYAVPGANEDHAVHVDAIMPAPRGASTIKQLLIGKTALGLEHALAVAARCTSLVHVYQR